MRAVGALRWSATCWALCVWSMTGFAGAAPLGGVVDRFGFELAPPGAKVCALRAGSALAEGDCTSLDTAAIRASMLAHEAAQAFVVRRDQSSYTLYYLLLPARRHPLERSDEVLEGLKGQYPTATRHSSMQREPLPEIEAYSSEYTYRDASGRSQALVDYVLPGKKALHDLQVWTTPESLAVARSDVLSGLSVATIESSFMSKLGRQAPRIVLGAFGLGLIGATVASIVHLVRRRRYQRSQAAG